MDSVKLVNKIRNYAIASFLVPLIAINSCLLIYKFLGNMNIRMYDNFNWNEVEHTYAYSEYHKISTDVEARTFTNCPKYTPVYFWTTIDDQTITYTPLSNTPLSNTPLGVAVIADHEGTVNELSRNNKLKSLTLKNEKYLNYQCVKNHQFTYSILKKYSWLETLLIHSIKSNVGNDGRNIGFAKIKNPYFYGEVSISRTARYFPAIIIFKSLIILSAFFLFLYWKNNLIFLLN